VVGVAGNEREREERTTTLTPPPPIHHTHTTTTTIKVQVGPRRSEKEEGQEDKVKGRRSNRLEIQEPGIFLFMPISANHQHQVYHYCPITWPVSGYGHKSSNMALLVPKFFAPIFFGEL
jgi:hypothetical protein